jgi:release factor glutamine methyltransferase
VTAPVLDLLREGARRLTEAGLPTARQDAEWLLAAVLGVARFRLYLEPREPVAARPAARYGALLERRAAQEPLQYLLGFEDFCGVRLHLTPAVLIPRPETEGLVAWARDLMPSGSGARAADVGTGSGAVACALAVARPDLSVVAVDSDAAALAVARDNVARLGLAGRVRLLRGDLLEPLGDGQLDVVAANLPYLPSACLDGLPREVSGFEPRLALDGGPDGLRLLRRLVVQAAAALRPEGWLVLEVGEDQAGDLASLMAAEGFQDLASRRDFRGVERYLAGRLPGVRREPTLATTMGRIPAAACDGRDRCG